MVPSLLSKYVHDNDLGELPFCELTAEDARFCSSVGFGESENVLFNPQYNIIVIHKHDATKMLRES